MVTTSYQCPASACFVDLVLITTRQDPPKSGQDEPPLCPWCCERLTPAPADSAAAAAAGELDQVSAPAPEGSDQVTQGNDQPERRGFEPPKLTLLPNDRLTRRRTDREPIEPAELARLRETGDQEGPSEHIRNALQILAGIVSYDGALLQDPTETTAAQMAARLVRAGEQIPIGATGAELYAPEVINAALAPFQDFRDAVQQLATGSAAHQAQAREAIVYTGQRLRFALNALLNALGPGAAPVPPEIVAAYTGEPAPAPSDQADGAQ